MPSVLAPAESSAATEFDLRRYFQYESTQALTASCNGMNDKWHYMTETKLRDGSVLLAGGYADNDRGTAQTWIYRP